MIDLEELARLIALDGLADLADNSAMDVAEVAGSVYPDEPPLTDEQIAQVYDRLSEIAAALRSLLVDIADVAAAVARARATGGAAMTVDPHQQSLRELVNRSASSTPPMTTFPQERITDVLRDMEVLLAWHRPGVSRTAECGTCNDPWPCPTAQVAARIRNTLLYVDDRKDPS